VRAGRPNGDQCRVGAGRGEADTGRLHGRWLAHPRRDPGRAAATAAAFVVLRRRGAARPYAGSAGPGGARLALRKRLTGEQVGGTLRLERIAQVLRPTPEQMWGSTSRGNRTYRWCPRDQCRLTILR